MIGADYFPRRARTTVAAALMLVGCVALPVAAQGTSPVTDPVFRTLYEPELIMKHRRAIGLTDEQRDAISRLIRELQGVVVSLQWELQDQSSSLSAELNRPQIDLDRALDRMGRVLQTERKIKEAHLTLLVRIKNVLRPEQQASLQQLREAPGQG